MGATQPPTDVLFPAVRTHHCRTSGCCSLTGPHIFQELKSTDMKYRNRVRSRISNLKDPKNPNLRRNVLCGAIAPSLIARMTAEVKSGVGKTLETDAWKQWLWERPVPFPASPMPTGQS